MAGGYSDALNLGSDVMRGVLVGTRGQTVVAAKRYQYQVVRIGSYPLESMNQALGQKTTEGWEPISVSYLDQGNVVHILFRK